MSRPLVRVPAHGTEVTRHAGFASRLDLLWRHGDPGEQRSGTKHRCVIFFVIGGRSGWLGCCSGWLFGLRCCNRRGSLQKEVVGVSEQPMSGDGLVLPEAFPVKSSQMDVETVAAAAGNLRAMGNTVDTHMDNIVAYWNGLPGVYVAPDADRVYGLMTPAAASAESLKTTFDKAATAIEEYAEALAPIKETLASLEKEATEVSVRGVGRV